MRTRDFAGSMRTRWNGIGLTLVEVLVALAIFLTFLSALFWLFIGGTRTGRLVSEQSRSVQEAEGVLHLLTYELGLAGFRGTGSSPLVFSGTGVTGVDADRCTSQVFTVCVQLGASGAGDQDEVWIRFFEVGGPVADSSPERWVTYRVQGDVLERVDQLLDVSVGNPVQGLVGGVDALVVEGFIRRNRSFVDRSALSGDATFWEGLSTELAGLRLRAQFSDESVWRFVVGLSNPQTLRVFAGDPLQAGD